MPDESASLPKINLEKDSILKSLDIYDNDHGAYYKFKHPLSEGIINQAFLNYINNCIKQEYGWGNIKETNRLIIHNQNPLKLVDNLSILVKNNLGIGYIKNKWKK